MPEWTTPELWLVWCRATSGSFSSTVTRRPGRRAARARAVASPTMPAPTTMTSVRSMGARIRPRAWGLAATASATGRPGSGTTPRGASPPAPRRDAPPGAAGDRGADRPNASAALARRAASARGPAGRLRRPPARPLAVGSAAGAWRARRAVGGSPDTKEELDEPEATLAAGTRRGAVGDRRGGAGHVQLPDQRRPGAPRPVALDDRGDAARPRERLRGPDHARRPHRRGRPRPGFLLGHQRGRPDLHVPPPPGRPVPRRPRGHLRGPRDEGRGRRVVVPPVPLRGHQRLAAPRVPHRPAGRRGVPGRRGRRRERHAGRRRLHDRADPEGAEPQVPDGP